MDHSYPLTTKKNKKTTLHTTLKQNKTNLVQDIKGGCSKHLPRMSNCVGKILQATNLDVWLLWKEVIMSLEHTFCKKKLEAKMVDKAWKKTTIVQ